MSRRAWVYVGTVLVIGTLIAVSSTLTLPHATQWTTLLVLLGAATIAQLFKADGPNHDLFHPAPVFIFAGALLLSPPLFVFLVLVPHLVEWAHERWRNSPHLRNWYLQPFNIAKHLIAGFAVQNLYYLSGSQGNVVTLALSGLVYVALHQILLGQALVLARDVSWRES